MDNCLKQPVFVVGDIDKNVNLSLPPSSGEEYIKRVVIEAQQCADVVVANIDALCMKQPTKNYIEPLAGCVQAPPKLSPTLEWQQYQVSDFSDMRLYVSQLRDEIQTYKRKWEPPDVHLPDINDESIWINLCLGCNSEEKLEPTLNTLFCFNQPTVEQVLEYFVHFVETERRIEYKTGQWIYTLLVMLEQPLNPDTCSCLRSLARICSVIRADSVIFANCSIEVDKYIDMLEINRPKSVWFFFPFISKALMYCKEKFSWIFLIFIFRYSLNSSTASPV